jgi:hypothetical protein
MEVHRTIMYEIGRPKETKLKKHPDVFSLEVVSARASHNLNLTVDLFFASATITIDTFKKVSTQRNPLRNLLILLI